MDNLPLAILPWGLPLALFSALYLAEWLSARRRRRKVERRLMRLRPLESWETPSSTSHPYTNYHGLSYPHIPKPYQRRSR